MSDFFAGKYFADKYWPSRYFQGESSSEGAAYASIMGSGSLSGVLDYITGTSSWEPVLDQFSEFWSITPNSTPKSWDYTDEPPQRTWEEIVGAPMSWTDIVDSSDEEWDDYEGGEPLIQFVGGSVAWKQGATSGNSTIPLNSGLIGGISSGVAAGDLVIAVFAIPSSSDITLAITNGSTSYTLITDLYEASAQQDANMRVAYRFMPSTPETSVSFGPTQSSTSGGAMAAYVFRGVSSTSPLDVTVTTNANVGGIPNPPSITPITPGAFVFCAGASAQTGGVKTFSSSDLSGFQSVTGQDVRDATLGVGYVPSWQSGVVNPAAFTSTSHSEIALHCSVAASVALRPAPKEDWSAISTPPNQTWN
jgi:hypothetical protein